MVICAPKRGVSSPTKANRKTTRKENNMPERVTLIKFRFTLIVLSLPTYILAIQQPFLKRIHQGKGRNKMWP
jgi:hypothetical protein